MKAHTALRTLFLTSIFILGSLLPALISHPVLAEPSAGQTTLYFTDALDYLETGNLSDYGFILMSQTTPSKQNDSEYPPDLFIKNTSKFLPRYHLNTEQWVTWFTSAWLLYFLQDTPEFNFTDIFSGFELFLPHPYRVVEGYDYTGDQPVTITGDIVYNLYFHSDIKKQKFRDQVKVELYSLNINSGLPLPKLIKNTNATLTPGLFSDVYNQQITLPDVSYTLKPGESLLFSVEIVPTNKTLPNLISKYIDVNRFISRWQDRANRWENRSRINFLHNLGTNLKDIISILNESLMNITSADLAAIVNAMRSSSFIYDSENHPASVSIPAKISAEDIRIYYLHADHTMDENRPATANQSTTSQITQTALVWTGPSLERNKILKVSAMTADLYLDHRDLLRIINLIRGKISITVTLYDINTTIDSSEMQLDRTGILDLLTKPTTPITFSFNSSDIEIAYDHTLGLGVSLKNNTKLGLRSVKLLYDSITYPSAIKVKVEDTQNINIKDTTSTPSNNKIIPGGTVEYLLNVSSKNADTIQIQTIEQEKIGDWDIITPEPVAVSADSVTTFPVLVTSTNDLNEAYGNSITLIIIAMGTTGIDKQTVSAEVSTDAIHYQVKLLGYAHSINVSKGENHNFYFVIKNNNTGATDDVDSYTITAYSQNNWPLTPRNTIRNLRRGDSTAPQEARVVIQVPQNTTATSDVITITVTSEGNSDASATINITVHVLGGGFFEDFYNLFNTTAESFGLNDMFGPTYGAIVLGSLIMIIIIFLLIILAFVFTTKPVHIICTERIKEIDATDTAFFELTLQNPLRKTQSYDINAEQTGPASKWDLFIEPTTLTIDGRQSKTVQITVTPTENTVSKDWTQVTIHAKKTGKKKSETVELLTTIKEGKTLLQLQNVTHWPPEFKPGERIVTSFSISNNGTITARNVKVFFYLNGKQKNMVEVTIPQEGIADIQIPWIAEKGKNQIRIKLKE
jgi:hypothetical protein